MNSKVFNTFLLNNKTNIIIISFILYSLFIEFYYVYHHNHKCNVVNINSADDLWNSLNPNSFTKYILSILFFIGLLSIFYVSYRFELQKNSDFYNKYINLFLLGSIIWITFTSLWFNLFIKESSFESGKSLVMKVFTIFFSIVFYSILFFYTFNNLLCKPDFLSAEFLILFWLLLWFSLKSYSHSSERKDKLLQILSKNQYNFLTINCMNKNPKDIVDSFEGINDTLPQLMQANLINKNNGGTYLQIENNVPIKFFNKIINDYQDLTLADFYYPGSYYSYLSDSPVNSHPSIEAIELALTQYKCRILHLDIFVSKNNINKLVVRSPNMAPDGEELSIDDCFATIKRLGWNDNQNYPIFLYLNFNDSISENLYNDLYYKFTKTFSKNLMNKKYSFSGRNGTFPISSAPIKECLNKIILITNNYPTRTAFDELIQAGNITVNPFLSIKLYKESYANFNGVGISQDQDKNKLIETSKNNISFYYTLPNKSLVKENENKSGLYNPNFNDLGQYGIQGSLMYLFVPDNSLNNWYMFFKSKNNLYPVLKDEMLRSINTPTPTIKQQDPIVGLQNPQKYCLIPGFMETEKSNITVGDSNTSCNT